MSTNIGSNLPTHKNVKKKPKGPSRTRKSSQEELMQSVREGGEELAGPSPRSAAGADVSGDVRRRLRLNREEEESVQKALLGIRNKSPSAEIEVFIDHESAEGPKGDIRIVIHRQFSSAEEILEYEKEIRTIVRSAEVGDTMLYTTIRRSDGN